MKPGVSALDTLELLDSINPNIYMDLNEMEMKWKRTTCISHSTLFMDQAGRGYPESEQASEFIISIGIMFPTRNYKLYGKIAICKCICKCLWLDCSWLWSFLFCFCFRYKYSYFSDGLISRLQNVIFAYTVLLFMSFRADVDWINIEKNRAVEEQHDAVSAYWQWWIHASDGWY